MNIRELTTSDFSSEYFNLLNQLSNSIDSISFDSFTNFINNLNDNHKVFVIEDSENKKIIGSGTVLIEDKLIHNLGRAAHIEDIVIDLNYRKNGVGKMLIDYLVEYSKNKNCYKIILDCQDKNILFYQKCGFDVKGVQMHVSGTLLRD